MQPFKRLALAAAAAWTALLAKHVVLLDGGIASQVRYAGMAADRAALQRSARRNARAVRLAREHKLPLTARPSRTFTKSSGTSSSKNHSAPLSLVKVALGPTKTSS